MAQDSQGTDRKFQGWKCAVTLYPNPHLLTLPYRESDQPRLPTIPGRSSMPAWLLFPAVDCPTLTFSFAPSSGVKPFFQAGSR